MVLLIKSSRFSNSVNSSIAGSIRLAGSTKLAGLLELLGVLARLPLTGSTRQPGTRVIVVLKL